MLAKTTFKAAALDVVAGFAAFCFLVAFLIIHRKNDLELFSLITAALFFFAGLFRGTNDPQNLLLKALLIDIGGVTPFVLMKITHVAFTEHGYGRMFAAFSLTMAVVGAGIRRLVIRGQLRTALVLAVLSFVGAAAAANIGIPALMAMLSSQHVNRPAPAFSLLTADGKSVTSTDLRGHVVVLAFWATWCEPCRQELPDLQKSYEQYKGNPNVRFYAVGGPWGEDTIEKESAFLNQVSLNLPLAFDSRGLEEGLGLHGFPVLVILDGIGHVRMIHSGYDASEHLARFVSKEVAALIADHT